MDANIIPWMEKSLQGVQNNSKILPPLRKKYRFTVELHICTMTQNYCIMCIHGMPKM